MTLSPGDRLCIVGAGLSGTGLAYGLRDKRVDVTILEKSRGVGGRAATRRKNGCRYDHGANYVKDSDDRTTKLLETLGDDGLVDITEPVWTFDAAGDIAPGDRQETHKWTWKAGITQFAKRLLDETDATLHKTTRVDTLTRVDDEWTLGDTDDHDHGPFDAVVLTPPAPQTANLLTNTTINGETPTILSDVTDAVSDVPFRTIRTLVLQYPFELELPYYALVNTDREHDISWLARESCKQGHVPDGQELLIIQMAPDWSTAHYDDSVESAADRVAGMVAELLDDERLCEPGWIDDQGWRYGLPNESLDTETVVALEDQELYLAGDWLAGRGRAHEAMWYGIETAGRLRKGA